MLGANMLFDMPPCGSNMKYKRDHLTLFTLPIENYPIGYDSDMFWWLVMQSFLSAALQMNPTCFDNTTEQVALRGKIAKHII